jgi:hypothetical protein
MRSTLTFCSATLIALAVATACARTAESSPDEAQNAAKDILATLKAISAGLNGTVTVHDAASGASKTSDGVISTDSTNGTLNHRVSFTVTNGKVVAKISYNRETALTTFLDYDDHTVTGSRKEVTTADGTSTENTSVSVDVRNDGRYLVSFRTDGVAGTWTMEEVSELHCKTGAASCNSSTTKNGDSAAQRGVGGMAGDGEGRVDPKSPNRYVGTFVTKIDFPAGGGTRTVTWDLSR